MHVHVAMVLHNSWDDADSIHTYVYVYVGVTWRDVVNLRRDKYS